MEKKSVRPKSVPKQRPDQAPVPRPKSTPKLKPATEPPSSIVQEVDEDDMPLSQRQAELALQLKVAASTATKVVLPPGLGLPPLNTTIPDLSNMDLETQPDSELVGTAIPESTALDTDLETQQVLTQPDTWEPLLDNYTLPTRQGGYDVASCVWPSSKMIWSENFTRFATLLKQRGTPVVDMGGFLP